MLTRLLVGTLLCAASAALVSGEERAADRDLPCPLGTYRFTLQGGALLDGAPGEQIVMSGTQVSLGSACPFVSATVVAEGEGNRVRARWPGCGPAGKSVSLSARIPVPCAVVQGTLEVGGARPRRVSGVLEECRDAAVVREAARRAYDQVEHPWGELPRVLLITQAIAGCRVVDEGPPYAAERGSE